MKTMNTYLPLLHESGNGVTFADIKLIKIISKNIPQFWKTQFRLSGGYRSPTVLEAQHVHLLLENQAKRSNNKTEGGKDRGKGSKGGHRNDQNDQPQYIKATSNSRQGGGRKSEKGGGHENPCVIPVHDTHYWKNFIYSSNGSNFKVDTRIPKYYNKETGKFKGTEKKKREENHRTEKTSSDDSSESGDKLNYNSDSTDEFNHIEGQAKSTKKSTLCAEILIAVSDGVGSKS